MLNKAENCITKFLQKLNTQENINFEANEKSQINFMAYNLTFYH